MVNKNCVTLSVLNVLDSFIYNLREGITSTPDFDAARYDFVTKFAINWLYLRRIAIYIHENIRLRLIGLESSAGCDCVSDIYA